MTETKFARAESEHLTEDYDKADEIYQAEQAAKLADLIALLKDDPAELAQNYVGDEKLLIEKMLFILRSYERICKGQPEYVRGPEAFLSIKELLAIRNEAARVTADFIL